MWETVGTSAVDVTTAAATLTGALDPALTAATVDAGKSTMLGVLSKGDLDDGRGRARVSLFNHRHEQESGRTSSVSIEIVGFDTVGRLVTSDTPGRESGPVGLSATGTS